MDSINGLTKFGGDEVEVNVDCFDVELKSRGLITGSLVTCVSLTS